MERHLDRRVNTAKEGGEQLHWYMVSWRRGGQAAINPSRSQSTLKKRGLIKFSFCLSLSLPLPLLFLSDAPAETNPCRLSVGLFRDWNNLLWVRETLQCLAKKKASSEKDSSEQIDFSHSHHMLDWISCVLEDFLKRPILKWIAERLVTRLKWMKQTHLEDRMAEWVPVQKHRSFWRHTPQSVCFYTVQASRAQQGVQTEAMYRVFISFYFRDTDERFRIFLRVCWLKAKVWKNLWRSLIVWLSIMQTPSSLWRAKRTESFFVSYLFYVSLVFTYLNR